MTITIELKEKESFGFLDLRKRNRIEVYELIQDESWLVDEGSLRIMKRVTPFSKNRVSQIVYPFDSIVKFTVEEKSLNA